MTQQQLHRRSRKSSSADTALASTKPAFANVIPILRLPRSVGILTYRVPETVDAKKLTEGTWVRVPFRATVVDGIVTGRTSSTEQHEKLRDIEAVLDVAPLLQEQLRVAEAFALFYAISVAHALYTFLPARPKRKLKKKWEERLQEEYLEKLSLPKSVQERIQQMAAEAKKHTTVFVPAGSLAERLAFYFSFLSTSTGQTRIVAPTHTIAQTLTLHLQKRFGSRVLFVNPTAGRSELWDQWNNAAAINDSIVITTKKGLLAPTKNLATIILDTETDPSHKQNDQNPRFHARTVATMLQNVCRAKLLGVDVVPSLTFSLLPDLFQEQKISTQQQFHIINLAHERTEKNYEPLARESKELVQTTQQPVLLFLNRRGFARALRCRDCSWTFLCSRCGGTMTQHLSGSFFCHRCQNTAVMPASCPQCHGTALHTSGMGTEQLMEYCKKAFPEKSVTLVDSEHLNVFSNVDIVVATEQILQFPLPRIFGSVIAVQADQLFQYPDFRTKEHALQTLCRLTTLAHDNATIVLQTYEPDDTMFSALKKGQPREWYKEELSLRTTLRLPPAVQVVKVLGKSADKEKLKARADQLVLEWQKEKNTTFSSVEGPLYAPLAGGRFTQAMIILRILPGKDPLAKLHDVLRLLPDAWRIDPDPDHLLP